MAQYRRIWTAFALTCVAFLGQASAGEVTPPADDPAWSACAAGAAQVEGEFGMPAYLLKAVALTESGRAGPDRSVTPWPWTVNLNDGTPGRRFTTKDEAVSFVREKRTVGARSLDVGCMQVNLMHHPRAFTSVAAAFEPLSNIRYAAQFLLQLREVSSNWEEAISRYHSYNMLNNYSARVLTLWQRERQQAALGLNKPTYVASAAANDRARLVLASAEVAEQGFLTRPPARPGQAKKGLQWRK